MDGQGENILSEIVEVRNTLAGIQGDIISQTEKLPDLTTNLDMLQRSSAALISIAFTKTSPIQCSGSILAVELEPALADCPWIHSDHPARSSRRNSGSGQAEGQRSVSALVIAEDIDRDIAILGYDPSKEEVSSWVKAFTLGELTTDNLAEPLMALGYSLAGDFRISLDGSTGPATANVGIYSHSFRQGWDEEALVRVIIIDAPTDPGDSGDPVLGARGRVVGIVRSVAVLRGVNLASGTFHAVM